jgi:hypothetical protein
MILQGLKPIIFDRVKPYVGKWIKELPSVLWACVHTVFFSLRIRGNVTHRSGAKVIPHVAFQ